ncbi:DUF4935 domain-containing protein [Pseudomonas brassicacearum]|uniref:PIN-like domain-containing protein n=1 Tax=Pseudomonas brassicacearum TaxID=930166 RepID=UPI0034662DEA
MRKAFPEHFVGEPERQQKLWADCLFVLDTNVLLDLYRFSDSARDALFKVMESLGERLWIPYQVAAEYFENRLGVIEDQSEAYAKSIAGLKTAKEKFNAGSRHPFVSDEVFNKFIDSYDLMIKELEGKQKIYLSYVGDDLVKAKLGTILNGRVGEPYSEERLQEVSLEGENRYAEHIPPGFQDGGKIPEATTTKLKLKKFGDLILWKQLIEKAMASDKPVILVTGEKKDDWWLKSDKRLISALPALSKEFMCAVNKDFYLYATDRFLVKANEYLKQSTSDVVVEEIRAINKAGAEIRGDMDNGLLDNAINAWPSDVVMKNLNKGFKKYYRPQNESNRSRQAHLDYLTEQKVEAQHRAKVLLDRLEMYVSEYEEITSYVRGHLSSDSPLDDEKYQWSHERMLALAAIIERYEKEYAAARNHVHNLIAHQRSQLEDED